MRFELWRRWLLIAAAAFNVWLVNVPCLAVMGLPLAAMRRAFGRPGTG